jgi:hypothetical protein
MSVVLGQPPAEPRHTKTVPDDRDLVYVCVVTYAVDKVLKGVCHLLMARTAVTETYRPQLVALIATLKKELSVRLPVAGITLVTVDEHNRRPLGSWLSIMVFVATPTAVKTTSIPRKPCRIRPGPLTRSRTATISASLSEMRDIRPKGC